MGRRELPLRTGPAQGVGLPRAGAAPLPGSYRGSLHSGSAPESGEEERRRRVGKTGLQEGSTLFHVSDIRFSVSAQRPQGSLCVSTGSLALIPGSGLGSPGKRRHLSLGPGKEAGGQMPGPGPEKGRRGWPILLHPLPFGCWWLLAHGLSGFGVCSPALRPAGQEGMSLRRTSLRHMVTARAPSFLRSPPPDALSARAPSLW